MKRPQEWTSGDERAFVAAETALRMAKRIIAHIEPHVGEENGPALPNAIGSVTELREFAELVDRLIDRKYNLQNPVRQFDPFTDRPEDPTTRGPDDG